MGGASFDPGHWDTFTTTKVAGKPTAAVFKASSLKESLDPKLMKSMIVNPGDDAVCPNSTAIIIGLDETGSMGIIPDYTVRTGFPKLFEEIYKRKPVTDPHIMFMGIGDDQHDKHPMQISQFEAGMRLAEQLTDIYLEGNGGNNNCEGYTFPWYMAAMHTKIDCFDKRGKKGYLFTVGDEEPNPILRKRDIERVLFGVDEEGKPLGCGPQTDLTARQLLDMVSRIYNVFHVIVEQGSYARYHMDKVTTKWQELLVSVRCGLRIHTKLSEVIVSAIQQCEGDSVATIVDSWKDPGTRAVVAHALSSSLTRPPQIPAWCASEIVLCPMMKIGHNAFSKLDGEN